MWLRNLIFKDIWLKLFSLALAMLIWFTVSFATTKQAGEGRQLLVGLPTQVIRVPVLVMSAASDVRALRVKPDYVEVVVRGEAEDLRKMQVRDIHAIVDLTAIEAARNMQKRIEITTPPGISYVSVTPDSVEVVLPAKK